MGKLLFILALLSISLHGRGQGGLNFNKVFYGPSFDKGVETVRLENGEFRVVGNTGSYGNGSSDIWVIALDTNADFLWQKTYGGQSDDVANDVIYDKLGNLYIIGYSGSNNIADYDILYMAIDSNGVPLFEKYYGGADWDFGIKMNKLSDSIFYATAQSYSFAFGKSVNYVLKFNNLGDTLATKISTNSLNLKPSDIGFSGFGDVFVCGNAFTDTSTKTTPYIIKLDEDLTISSLVLFPDSDNMVFSSMIVHPDSTLFIAGSLIDSPNVFKDPFTLKINFDFSTKWFHNQSHGGDAWFNAVDTFGGYYFISGVTKFFAVGEEDFYFARFSHDGYWEKGSVSGGDNYEEPFSISFNEKDSTILTTGTTGGFAVPGSGILVCQRSWDFPNTTAIELVMISGLNNSQDEVSKVRIYPVPFDDFITVELLSEGINEIKIFSQTGQLLTEVKAKPNQRILKINTSNLTQGAYLVAVNNNFIKIVKK